MASPTQVGGVNAGSSKTSGTSLIMSNNSGGQIACRVGDLIVAYLAMDPATGTVSFAASGVTVGTWTAIRDISNGSGTSGVRLVVAYAVVTVAGAFTSVTATHPTVTARSGQTFALRGCDGTTPVSVSASSTTGAPSLTPTSSGVDAVAISIVGTEAASGTACTSTGPAGWSTIRTTGTTGGTSGGNATTNISDDWGMWSQTNIPTTAITPSVTTSSGTKAWVGVIFQHGPTVVAPGTLSLVVTRTWGAGVVRLDWNDDIVGFPDPTYEIWRSTDNITFSAIQTGIGAGNQTYQNTGLAAGTTYYYKVRATNSAGQTDTTAPTTTVLNSFSRHTGFEAQPNGTALASDSNLGTTFYQSTTNSGSATDDPLDFGGGVFSFSTARSHSGATSLLSSNFQGSALWLTPPLSPIYMRCYLWISEANPLTSAITLMTMAHEAGFTTIELAASSSIITLVSGGTATGVAVPVAQWMRLELQEFGAASGVVIAAPTLRVYHSPEAITPDQTLTPTSPTATGANTQLTLTSGQTGVAAFWLNFDDLALSDQGWIGPLSTGGVPTPMRRAGKVTFFDRIPWRREKSGFLIPDGCLPNGIALA